jgi:hypothetical protein
MNRLKPICRAFLYIDSVTLIRLVLLAVVGSLVVNQAGLFSNKFVVSLMMERP